MKKNKIKKIIRVAITLGVKVSKLAFIGFVAGYVIYIAADARNTRDNLIYSKGVVSGGMECRRKGQNTSMPTGDIEQMETWLIE